MSSAQLARTHWQNSFPSGIQWSPPIAAWHRDCNSKNDELKPAAAHGMRVVARVRCQVAQEAQNGSRSTSVGNAHMKPFCLDFSSHSWCLPSAGPRCPLRRIASRPPCSPTFLATSVIWRREGVVAESGRSTTPSMHGRQPSEQSTPRVGSNRRSLPCPAAYVLPFVLKSKDIRCARWLVLFRC